ncbi:hypothetical protein K504DRAFT_435059 [Pleomassaria siparia CBS 279.74]|uniref:Uncharacterized protein n=1 Tax=Pleomassaria siparia CBS 279.74 TaxID=1314801 RepID=A0A6G1K7J6_9PLEO|nr:hypothetical protein K504DRAFT_435059 [Pleomassaria siparia CBS 279.74]
MASTSASVSLFKPPPVVQCISRDSCLGLGKKVHVPNKICIECLTGHDPKQLQIWANENVEALDTIEEEVARKQMSKRNMESHGRFLCAFEDPDYLDSRWRRSDLNLRGVGVSCASVKRKGMACRKPLPCAFGRRCFSRKPGEVFFAKEEDANAGICQDCQNRSTVDLRNRAEYMSSGVRKLVHDHTLKLMESALSDERKDWPQSTWIYTKPVCAMRHPNYQGESWRCDFVPRLGRRPCEPTAEHDVLCSRCARELRRQVEEDPTFLNNPKLENVAGSFENFRRLGFPCLFVDPRYNGKEGIRWREWVDPATGKKDKLEWMDPETRCRRTKRKDSLCDKCYARCKDHRRYREVFKGEDPELQARWTIKD